MPDPRSTFEDELRHHAPGDDYDPAAYDVLANGNGNGNGGALPSPLDWHELFAKDRGEADWLVEDLWPRGRSISLTAPRKAGKSLLMLYLAACLAKGRCPWTGRAVDPVRVVYLDFEMTEDDVLERLEDMGFGPADLHNLRYFLQPRLPMLDTAEGGRMLLALIIEHEAQAMTIDTFSRVVTTKDNTGQEVNAFYRWSAQHVKSRGCAIGRLDHTGHENHHRATGSAAKGTDVDVGWVIHPGDGGGLRLEHHGLTRVRWVPDKIDLTMTEDPLAFRRAMRTWMPGVAEAALLLDRLDVPLGASANQAMKALSDAGEGRRKQVVLQAVSYRRDVAR